MWLACGGRRPGTEPTPADAPQISCPADVTVSSVATPTQPVTFSDPTVTKGALPVTTTCSPGSGATFPLGATPVKCQASDATSRTASCTFTVTLKGFAIAVTKYVAFGDSVTEGQNGQRFGIGMLVDTPNAYPTQLQSSFDATYPNQGVTVVNQGFGGEFVEKAVQRLPSVMAAERPGAVLLISGYNNLLVDCGVSSGSPSSRCSDTIELVAGKLRECVRIARQGGAAFVFVGTLTPPGPFVPTPGYVDRRIDPNAITRVNSRIRSQVPGEGAVVVDVYPLFLGHEAEYTSPDGLHLFAPGNRVLADAFFSAIRNTVPQSPTLASGAHQ
jgi:lysophospholipase L1-like esterase